MCGWDEGGRRPPEKKFLGVSFGGSFGWGSGGGVRGPGSGELTLIKQLYKYIGCVVLYIGLFL